MARNEPDSTGTDKFAGLQVKGQGPRRGVAEKVSLALPEIKVVTDEVKGLTAAIKELHAAMEQHNRSNVAGKMLTAIKGKIGKLAQGLSPTRTVAGTESPVGETTFDRPREELNRSAIITPPSSTSQQSSPTAPTGGAQLSLPGMSVGPNPVNLNPTDPQNADSGAASHLGKLISSVQDYVFQKAEDAILNKLPLVGAGSRAVMMTYGAVAGSGLQYAYNRINGPTGNQNAALQAAQVLGPQVTLMNSSGYYGDRQFNLRKTISGLASETPVLGTEQDILSTIQAGTNVGAALRGTPGRNGFYESVRQMQALNPGQAPGNLANGLAGYLSNTQSQQRGIFLGQGAFTMFGQGGGYKTLAEWADGITKFLEQQRGGGVQGKPFTRAELLTQNFPGSNINAWFQMMGVPDNMVDYWWQYVLTDTSQYGSDITSQQLLKSVSKDRGVNLGFERLRNVSAGTQREFKMSAEMYKTYAVRESADRRFNQTMGGVDQALGQLIQDSQIGNILAMMPTPLMEFLMPILTGIATSPIGAGASILGHLLGGGDSQGGISGALNSVGNLFRTGGGRFGDPPSPGDRMPFGDVGPYGGITTSHLSPDLARRVQEMLKANPRLQISSSYRDTHTQNRLRKQGGPVERPSRSAHTRGWAVDIGPMSQSQWLMANASKFGLQTAASQGEPWHVQLAGSMHSGGPRRPLPNGDPPTSFLAPYGDLKTEYSDADQAEAERSYGKTGLNLAPTTDDNPTASLLAILKYVLFGGKATDFASMVDYGTNAWAHLMLAPLSGLLKLMGTSNIFTGDNKVFKDILGSDSDAIIRVPVASQYAGFDSNSTFASRYNSLGDPPVSVPQAETPTPMGDPATRYSDERPFGDPVDLLMRRLSPQVAASPSTSVVFHNQITVNTSGTMNGTAAKAAASAIADQLEAEVSRRQWSVV